MEIRLLPNGLTSNFSFLSRFVNWIFPINHSVNSSKPIILRPGSLAQFHRFAVGFRFPVFHHSLAQPESSEYSFQDFRFYIYLCTWNLITICTRAGQRSNWGKAPKFSFLSLHKYVCKSLPVSGILFLKKHTPLYTHSYKIWPQSYKYLKFHLELSSWHLMVLACKLLNNMKTEEEVDDNFWSI